METALELRWGVGRGGGPLETGGSQVKREIEKVEMFGLSKRMDGCKCHLLCLGTQGIRLREGPERILSPTCEF